MWNVVSLAPRRALLRWPGLALVALASAALATACAGCRLGPESTMQEILANDGRFARLLAGAEAYRLQVLLGVIERGEDGRERLAQSGFRVDAEYFYPASSIKLCAAVAALEELARLRLETGLAIDPETPLAYHPLFAEEALEEADPTHLAGGTITVAHEIRKLFLVSDNVAYNRLYELVGPAALNASMHRVGLASSRIVHRLSEARSEEENLRLPRIDFRGVGFLHAVPERRDRLDLEPIPVGGLSIGRAYLSGGERVEGPMDFRGKNRMSLVDLQRALAKVVRPELEVGGEPFRLGEAERALLLGPMSELPRASADPVYDPAEVPDHYAKFLLPGLLRVLPAERLRISNKIGRAYGFSVENAYVEDLATGRAFFLAAAIYTNRDGVLNDDRYEYEEVADPFLADLGEAVARHLWGEAGG